MSEIETVGVFVLAGAALIVALFAVFRTRNIKPLETFIDARVEDVQLTTALEDRFLRLSPTAQESIMKLIRVADPLADYWPGDLDNKVIAWLQEISDGTPLKDKPESDDKPTVSEAAYG